MMREERRRSTDRRHFNAVILHRCHTVAWERALPCHRGDIHQDAGTDTEERSLRFLCHENESGILMMDDTVNRNEHDLAELCQYAPLLMFRHVLEPRRSMVLRKHHLDVEEAKAWDVSGNRRIDDEEQIDEIARSGSRKNEVAIVDRAGFMAFLFCVLGNVAHGQSRKCGERLFDTPGMFGNGIGRAPHTRVLLLQRRECGCLTEHVCAVGNDVFTEQPGIPFVAWEWIGVSQGAVVHETRDDLDTDAEIPGSEWTAPEGFLFRALPSHGRDSYEGGIG